MYILKNVSSEVIEYVMGLKDSVAVRKDLEVAGIKQEWWVTDNTEVSVRGRGRGRYRGCGRGRGRGGVNLTVVRFNNIQYKYFFLWIIGFGTTLLIGEAEVELRKRVFSIRFLSGYGLNLRRSF